MKKHYFILIIGLFIISGCVTGPSNEIVPNSKPLTINWDVFPKGEIDPEQGINAGLKMEYLGPDIRGEVILFDTASPQVGGIDSAYGGFGPEDFSLNERGIMEASIKPLGNLAIVYNQISGVETVNLNAIVRIVKQEEAVMSQNKFCIPESFLQADPNCPIGQAITRGFPESSSISNVKIDLSSFSSTGNGRIDVEFMIKEPCNIVSSESFGSKDIDVKKEFDEEDISVFLSQGGNELICQVNSDKSNPEKQKIIKCQGDVFSTGYQEGLRVNMNYGCEYKLDPYTVKFRKKEGVS